MDKVNEGNKEQQPIEDIELEKLAVKAAIPITDEILERGFYSLGFKAGYKAALSHTGKEGDAIEFVEWDYAYDIFKETEDFKVSTAKNLVYIYKIWLERNYKLYKNKPLKL